MLGGSSMWKYTEGNDLTGFSGTGSHGYSGTDLEQPKVPWEREAELEESGSLTSDYTIKLRSSKQSSTGTKTDTQINGTAEKAQK